MTGQHGRRLVGLGVPLVCNLALGGFLVWQFLGVPAHARQFGFRAFVWFYAVGGLAVAMSAAALFVLAASDRPAPRGSIGLAVLNIVLPTVLMFLFFQLR